MLFIYTREKRMIIFEIIAFMTFWICIDKVFLKKIFVLPSILTIIWGITLSLSYLGLYNIFVPPKEVAFYSFIFIK